MEIAARKSHPVERTPETVGVELGEHLVAVDFLDDERHDEHHRRPHGPQCGHQGRGRGRTVEVDDPGTHREGIDHADRTFVGVRQRQHRKEDVAAADGEDRGRHVHLCTECAVGEHHALGLGGRARRIDDDGQVVGRRHRHGTLAAHPLRDDAQVLGADHDVEPLDRMAGELREEAVRNEQRPCLGVLDDHVEFLAREVGKDRHDNHAGRRYSVITDAPVGHVAAQQSHLVAGPQARTAEDLLHAGDPASDFGIGQLLTVVHGKRNPVGEFFHAVANQSVQSIDCHNSVFITA